MTTQQGLDDIQRKLDEEWTFAGSIETGSYLKPLPYIPRHQTKCLCGHPIDENFYIINKDKTIVKVVGSQCITKFTGGLKRTCENCGASHKTRNWDLCIKCKKPVDTAEKNVIRIAKQVKKRMNDLIPMLDIYINMHNTIRNDMLKKLKSCMGWYTDSIWLDRKINRGFEFYQAEPIYLNVPYAQREIAKAQYGCSWSGCHKRWYCYEKGIDAIVKNYLAWCCNSFKYIHEKRIAYGVENRL